MLVQSPKLFPMRSQKTQTARAVFWFLCAAKAAHTACAFFCFPFVYLRETIRNNQKQSETIRNHGTPSGHGPPSGDDQELCPCMHEMGKGLLKSLQSFCKTIVIKGGNC